MNYICLCEDTSNHYPFHYCGSSPASSDDKDTITKTKNALCYMVYADCLCFLVISLTKSWKSCFTLNNIYNHQSMYLRMSMYICLWFSIIDALLVFVRYRGDKHGRNREENRVSVLKTLNQTGGLGKKKKAMFWQWIWLIRTYIFEICFLGLTSLFNSGRNVLYFSFCLTKIIYAYITSRFKTCSCISKKNYISKT